VRAPEPVNVPVPADQAAVLPPSLPPPDHAPAPVPPTQATSPAQKGGKRKTPADEEDDSGMHAANAPPRSPSRPRHTDCYRWAFLPRAVHALAFFPLALIGQCLGSGGG
jgi:hypothetical protein